LVKYHPQAKGQIHSPLTTDIAEAKDNEKPSTCSSPSSPSPLVRVKVENGRSFLVTPKVGDVVRGRLFTDHKPPSFNKLWTEEEQRRLENLLIEYPDEEISAHRWAKIARALGNRTPKQVASRTQKYFIKLQKMGIPVPGKPPSMTGYLNKINNVPPKKKQKTGDDEDSDDSCTIYRRIEYYVPPPVLMRENRRPVARPPAELSSIPLSLQGTPEYQELLQLLNSKTDNDTSNERVIPRNNLPDEPHEGYKCDGCGTEPIVGVRWHCKVCREVDLCSSCHDSAFETASHKPTHKMEEVSQSETVPSYYRDDDYQYSHGFGEANYLDPNSNL